MNLKNFIAGVEILRPYYEDMDGHHLSAGHDQIYLYATQDPLTETDAKRMFELGWFQDECAREVYDPSEGWSCHV